MKAIHVLTGAVLLAGSLLAGLPAGASAAPPGAPAVPSVAAAAATALRDHRAEIRGSADDGYVAVRTVVEKDGAAHVRYDRTYRGLPVRGGDFVVHLAPGGGYAGVSQGLARPLSVATTPRVTAAAAARTAAAHTAGTPVGEPRLLVDATAGPGRLVWEAVIRGTAPDGAPSRRHLLIDATTGAYVSATEDIETVFGTGHTLYSGSVGLDTTPIAGGFQLVDPSHGNGSVCNLNHASGDNSSCPTVTDPDNNWGDGTNGSAQTAATDAQYGAATTMDYYRSIGRDGIFGTGQGAVSRVHFGNNFVNAYWDRQLHTMTYGDGAGNARPLVELDVAAHEMTHGVTQALVPGGLNPRIVNDLQVGETGALNESTSDILGTTVEFFAQNPSDPPDYTIGEKLNVNGDNTPGRYLYNPALDGHSDGCWTAATDNHEVHDAAGVGNHFFFDLAEGTGSTQWGTSPVCGSAPGVAGIGRAKAAAIWYRALDLHFTSTTRYFDATNNSNSARNYTLLSAAELYGPCGTEYRAVQAAWTAVGVLAGGDAVCRDFSMALSPASDRIDAGLTTSTTVSITVPNGSIPPVNLTVTGLRAGMTASFAPPTVTGTAPSVLTVHTSSTTPPGSVPLVVHGDVVTNGYPVSRSATFGLFVDGVVSGCTVSNGANVAIPDTGAAVGNSVQFSTCDLVRPPTGARMEVHIVHPHRGDLVLTLVGPDGVSHPVKFSDPADAGANIDQTFGVDLVGVLGFVPTPPPTGPKWSIQVQDVITGNTGVLDSWTLTLF